MLMADSPGNGACGALPAYSLGSLHQVGDGPDAGRTPAETRGTDQSLEGDRAALVGDRAGVAVVVQQRRRMFEQVAAQRLRRRREHHRVAAFVAVPPLPDAGHQEVGEPDVVQLVA